jgi:transporter family protein
MNWIVASIIALICWGIWGVFLKQASKYYSWPQIFVVSTIATTVASLAVFLVMRPNISFSSPGFSWSLLGGILSAIAILSFYSAMQGGKTTIVVPLTALYPVVTILFSYLVLSERISSLKAIGVVLALIAILLLSIE